MGPSSSIVGRLGPSFCFLGGPFLAREKEEKPDRTDRASQTEPNRTRATTGSQSSDQRDRKGQSVGAGGDREASFNNLFPYHLSAFTLSNQFWSNLYPQTPTSQPKTPPGRRLPAAAALPGRPARQADLPTWCPPIGHLPGRLVRTISGQPQLPGKPGSATLCHLVSVRTTSGLFQDNTAAVGSCRQLPAAASNLPLATGSLPATHHLPRLGAARGRA